MKKENERKQSNEVRRNNHGITLVALIITIIILIILAAVTINSLTHEGLTDMAIKGAEDYDKAQKDEMNMLNDIDSMLKETMKNIDDGKPSKPDKPDTEDPEGTIDPGDKLTEDDIGKIVNYKPIQGTVTKDYLDKVTGNTENQEMTTEDLNWIVWKLDDEYVYLISDKSTSQKITISGYMRNMSL